MHQMHRLYKAKSLAPTKGREEKENSYQLLEMVHDELNWQRAHASQ
jgi:hypothetical protein